MAWSLLSADAMQYEGFVQACRALGLRAQHFRDREQLAHALEQSVDAGNVSTIVRLLNQMTEEDFDPAQAGRVFRQPRLDVAWSFTPWAPLEVEDSSFYCGAETDRLRAWLAAMPREVRRPLLSFFTAPSNRFLLIEELGSVRLTVHDAALELSYTLPARFDLDPAKAKQTGTELLRHLRIGTLYHAVVTCSVELDAERILSMLAGEPIVAANFVRE